MSQYEPLDNDSDCIEFEVEKIEKMEVEFEPCRICDGCGLVWNGTITRNCPACHGCGDVPIEKEG